MYMRILLWDVCRLELGLEMLEEDFVFAVERCIYTGSIPRMCIYLYYKLQLKM